MLVHSAADDFNSHSLLLAKRYFVPQQMTLGIFFSHSDQSQTFRQNESCLSDGAPISGFFFTDFLTTPTNRFAGFLSLGGKSLRLEEKSLSLEGKSLSLGKISRVKRQNLNTLVGKLYFLP